MLRIAYLLFFCCFFTVQGEEDTIEIKKILRLEIDSSINPATYDYIKSGMQEAKEKECDLILIRLSTPGGLISTTKDILKLIGESAIPVGVWVAPAGASATSAGAIIASAAHVLLMSEGSNMGAATPVMMGKNTPKDLRQKGINDLSALIQSLAEAHGRNPKGLEDMISEAHSFAAREAMEEKFIDAIVNTEKELLKHLQGRKVTIKGKKMALKVINPHFIPFKMDLGQSLLNIFANPSLAYILFLLGAALIYLEFQAPGGFIAGAVGVFSLILSGIGFQVLPLNFGAIGLIIASFILFIMEIFVPSFGVLSLLGVVSLVTGSLFLFRTENSYLELGHEVIFSAVGAIVIFVLLITIVVMKTHKNIGRKNFNDLVGKLGVVCKSMGPSVGGKFLYQVKAGGEIWQAQSDSKLEEGASCKVVEQDQENMLLIVSNQ